MLNFLKARRSMGLPCPAIAPGARVYAIGDIHGRSDLLDALLARIEGDDASRGAANTIIVFLGDVIDRGPDSAGVVERLIQLKAERPSTRLLLGNHEEIFLSALAGDEQAVRAFCRVGGRETLISYGVTEAQYERLDHAEAGAALAELVPEAHRLFVAGFEDMVVLDDYVFVHAGIDPAVQLADQKASALRWIRRPFLDHKGMFEKVVVHGHTVHHEVEYRSNRIGIDTGAYDTGKLSALCLEGCERWILQT